MRNNSTILVRYLPHGDIGVELAGLEKAGLGAVLTNIRLGQEKLKIKKLQSGKLKILTLIQSVRKKRKFGKFEGETKNLEVSPH